MAGSSQYKCTWCDSSFSDSVALKAHYKTNWHLVNLKRAQRGFLPDTEEQFLRKAKLLNDVEEVERGTDHLKKTNKTNVSIKVEKEENAIPQHLEELTCWVNLKPHPVEGETYPKQLTGKCNYHWSVCFMCGLQFETIQDIVDHMETHGLILPKMEKNIGYKNMLNFYFRMLHVPPHYCFGCNREFKTWKAAVQHMETKKHCFVDVSVKGVRDMLRKQPCTNLAGYLGQFLPVKPRIVATVDEEGVMCRLEDIDDTQTVESDSEDEYLSMALTRNMEVRGRKFLDISDDMALVLKDGSLAIPRVFAHYYQSNAPVCLPERPTVAPIVHTRAEKREMKHFVKQLNEQQKLEIRTSLRANNRLHGRSDTSNSHIFLR